MEKYMAIMIREELVFIDKMQSMSSNLEEWIEYLTKFKFEYLFEEFQGNQLERVKHKRIHPYEYTNSFEKFNEK